MLKTYKWTPHGMRETDSSSRENNPAFNSFAGPQWVKLADVKAQQALVDALQKQVDEITGVGAICSTAEIFRERMPKVGAIERERQIYEYQRRALGEKKNE